jgi:hypothetical protein
MLGRCTDPENPSWHNYGGRGITVCQRWKRSFANFIEDMGARPHPSLTIERINNDGNYEPSNCKWATRKEQCRNRRGNTLLTHNGHTRCLAEWSEHTGISVDLLIFRLRKGWSVKETLETDPKDYNKNRPARTYTHKGTTKSVVQWAREQGLSIQRVLKRLELGWSMEKALFFTGDARRIRQSMRGVASQNRLSS